MISQQAIIDSLDGYFIIPSDPVLQSVKQMKRVILQDHLSYTFPKIEIRQNGLMQKYIEDLFSKLKQQIVSLFSEKLGMLNDINQKFQNLQQSFNAI